MTARDGGPAFPHDKYMKGGDGGWGTFAHGGMSLRDWFAGQALSALVDPEDDGATHPDVFAEHAYSIADAMLAAREQQP